MDPDKQTNKQAKTIILLVCIAFAILLLGFATRDYRITERYNDLADDYNELYQDCYGDIFQETEKENVFYSNITIS